MSSRYKSHGITPYSHFVHDSPTNQKVPIILISCMTTHHTTHAFQFKHNETTYHLHLTLIYNKGIIPQTFLGKHSSQSNKQSHHWPFTL